MYNQLPGIGERVEKAALFVPECGKLLDVGCGDGVIEYYIKTKVKKIYGIDNNPKELETSRQRGIITKLVNLDSELFPFKNDYFDVITCLDVIEHVLDPRVLLKEIYRVLRKEGLLILSTPNIRFSDHIYELLVKGTFPKTSLDPLLYDGGHIHFFTYSDIHLLLEQTGFASIQDEEIINKKKRGWKGRLIQTFIGRKNMREFRTPGILVIAKK